jgi:serine/threonine-protein kinase HipA
MTRYCLITYDAIPDDALYSARGLHQLSPKLNALMPLPYSAQEQRNEAMSRASKLSIQGV